MSTYKAEIAAALARATGGDAGELEKLVAPPPPHIPGDFAFPCFALAKSLKRPPAQIARELITHLSLPAHFEKAEPVQAYINFHVDFGHLTRATLEAISQSETRYGRSTKGRGKTVTIDFSSPNMGKELAFHHLRGTMLGHSLANILEAVGYTAIRINHLGDWGTSYGKLLLMYTREGLGESPRDLEKIDLGMLNRLYVDFAQAAEDDRGLEDEARAVFQKLESGDERFGRLWKAFRDVTWRALSGLYSRLGVRFDDTRGESYYAGKCESLIRELEAMHLVESSRGAKVVDLSDMGLPPLLLKKTDGSTLYGTRDLAAALHRHKTYTFSRNLYVVDNGQSLHFKQIFGVLRRMGLDWVTACEHVPFGLILNRSPEGSWEKGKTRAGRASLLKEVISAAEERVRDIIREKNPGLARAPEVAGKIAVGALIFNELKSRRLNDVRFDWDAALSFEGDSGPYIVNAYVRLRSIQRKKYGHSRQSPPGEMLPSLRAENLEDPQAVRLVRILAAYPDKVAAAADTLEPSVLAQYGLELAEGTHAFLHACRVLGSGQEFERLLLVGAASEVLRDLLEMLGIPVVEAM